MTRKATPSHGGERRHRPDTAGHLASESFLSVRATERIGAVLKRIGASSHEACDLVLITDEHGRYRGVVDLPRLLRASESTQISEVSVSEWPFVTPEVDQEHAVQIADEARVAALPVVSREGRPIGVITPFVLLDALAREHREDIHRLVGILKERDGSRHALEDSPAKRAARRLPWLLVGLAMSAAATAVMAEFEAALQANVAIAFFIPALVYLADAVGTQTEAIAIRGLSARRRPLPTILLGEIVTGGMIGLVLAVVAFLGVWLVFKDLALSLGVATSLLVAGTLASSIGLMLPWMLAKMRIDPAFGTGPVATIIQDVLTISVYFTIITTLL